MATTVARLEAVLSANTRDFDRGMDKSESKMTSMAKTAGKAGLAGAILGVGIAAKIGFSEFIDAQKVTAQTNAVLKSTGGIANVTAAQIDKLSNSLLKKSGVDDEQIKAGENLLLTFTNIRNEVGKGNDIFNQATTAALDLSVAFKKDMASSSILVGKALNDPIKGISALTRVGVTFSQQQKDQIKAMVAAGDTMGAQKVIIAELNKEVGGSAEAAGKTLPGAINIARETINNWLGDLVAKAIPTLTEMVGWLRDHWPEIRTAIKTALDAVEPIIRNIGDLFVAIAGIIKDNWGTIGPILQKVGTFVQSAAKVIAGAIKLVTDLLKGDWSAAWNDAKGIVTNAINGIKALIEGQLMFMKAIGAKLGTAIKDGVVGAVTGTAAEVWNLINNVGGLVAAGLATIKGWGVSVGVGIKNGVIDGVTGVASAVWNVINNIGGLIAGFAKEIKGWGSKIGGWIVDAIIDAFAGLGKKLGNAITGAIKGAAGSVKGAISGANPFGDAADASFVPPASSFGAVAGVTGGDSTINKDLWDELSLGRSMGLTMTSGYRPGAITSHGTPSDHGTFPSKAIDMAGPPSQMAAFFSRLIGDRGVKQAFYDPLGSIFGGMLSSYREGGHSDHVHVATYDKGGYLRPGWNLAFNGLGRPEPVGAAMDGGPSTIVVQLGTDTLARLVRNAKGQWEQRNGKGSF